MVTTQKKKNTGNPFDCPLTAAIDKIGGRWKPIILFYLSNGSRRFGQLGASIPMISKKVLSQQLKELADDGLIVRKQFNEVPLRVEYSLTDFGKSVLPILDKICEWGKQFVDITQSKEVLLYKTYK
ncbi:MAG: transcriptional regulator [Bacteroidetes bacterium]|nr:MAG: transcriptional regulator [Bacteroidota bacterium]